MSQVSGLAGTRDYRWCRNISEIFSPITHYRGLLVMKTSLSKLNFKTVNGDPSLDPPELYAFLTWNKYKGLIDYKVSCAYVVYESDRWPLTSAAADRYEWTQSACVVPGWPVDNRWAADEWLKLSWTRTDNPSYVEWTQIDHVKKMSA